MAGGFLYNVQVNIQAPQNLKAVSNQIRNELRGITASVNVELNKQSLNAITELNKNLVTTSSSIKNLNKDLSDATNNLNRFASANSSARGSTGTLADLLNRNTNALRTTNNALKEGKTFAEDFGAAIGLATRRFGAFVIGAGAILGTVNTIKGAVKEAFEFERGLVKIQQVSGVTQRELTNLTKEISRLSTTYGVAAKELLEGGLILQQAGFNINETKKALDALAKAALNPNFGNIKDTAEGLIAINAQFKIGVDGFEKSLSAIAAVSNQYAVESQDLVDAVRRVGGTFRTTGGDLNELLGVMTSVRSTTRESTESIATGLRTIFSRLQRADVVESLKNLGVELRRTRQEAEQAGDLGLEGQFVGAFEAIKRISAGLAGLRETDARYSAIIEELGGVREISKTIPLIQEIGRAQAAYNVALNSTNSLTASATIAQESYSQKILILQQQLLELGRTIINNSGFKALAGGFLQIATGAAKAIEAITPLLPLLAAVGTVSLGRLALSLGSGAIERLRAPTGGTHKFARGGIVPGFGEGDTVPAMLEPGEFVIKKTSAQKIGYDKLSSVNKYADGDDVVPIRYAFGDYVNKYKSAYETGIEHFSSALGVRRPSYVNDIQVVPGEDLLNKKYTSSRAIGAYDPGTSNVILGYQPGNESFSPKQVYNTVQHELGHALDYRVLEFARKDSPEFNELMRRFYPELLQERISPRSLEPQEIIAEALSRSAQPQGKIEPATREFALSKVFPYAKSVLQQNIGKSYNFNRSYDTFDLFNQIQYKDRFTTLGKIRRNEYAYGDIVKSKFKELNKTRNNLSESELSALEDYTSSLYSSEIINSFDRNKNFLLSNEYEEHYRNQAKILINAIRKNSLPEDTRLYRGLGLSSLGISELDDDLIGELINNRGFISTSLDKKIAKKFVDADNGVLLRINAHKGTNFLTGSEHERELILPPDTRLKVNKYKQGIVNPDLLPQHLLPNQILSRSLRSVIDVDAFPRKYAHGDTVNLPLGLSEDDPLVAKYINYIKGGVNDLRQQISPNITSTYRNLSLYPKYRGPFAETEDTKRASGVFQPYSSNIALQMQPLVDPTSAFDTTQHEIFHAIDQRLYQGLGKDSRLLNEFAFRFLPERASQVSGSSLETIKYKLSQEELIAEGLSRVASNRNISENVRSFGLEKVFPFIQSSLLNIDPRIPLGIGESKLDEFINSRQNLRKAYSRETNSKSFSLESFLNKRFAQGGQNTDTVPALLTPGEFIINKDSASKIGIPALREMNERGKVQGYATGGFVQKYQDGNTITGTTGDLKSIFGTEEYKDILRQIIDNLKGVALSTGVAKSEAEAQKLALQRANLETKQGAKYVVEPSAIGQLPRLLGSIPAEAPKPLYSDIRQRQPYQPDKEVSPAAERAGGISYELGQILSDRTIKNVLSAGGPGLLSQKTQDKITSDTAERLQKELVSVLQQQISVLRPGIKASEARLIAEQRFSEALLSNERVVTKNNKLLGFETEVTQLQAQGKPLESGFFARLLSGSGKTGALSTIGGAASRFNESLLGQGGLITGAALAYGSSFIKPGEPQSEGFTRRSALSGALQGAGVGLGIGASLPFVPFAAAIGTAVGAVTGFVSALSSAEKEIRQVKLANTLTDVSKLLASLSTGTGPISQSGLGQLTSQLNSSIKQIDIQAREQATGFFTGFDAEEFTQIRRRELDKSFNQITPQIAGVLNRQATELAKQNVGIAPANVLETFKTQNATLIQTLSRGSGRTPNEIAKDFEKLIKDVQSSTGLEQARERNRAEFEILYDSFGRLSDGIGAAQVSLERFAEGATTSLSSLNNAKLTGLNFEGLKTFGAPGSTEFVDASRRLSGLLGPSGDRLRQTAEIADAIQKVLPSAIAEGFRANPENSAALNVSISRTLRGDLKNQGFDLENPILTRQIQSIETYFREQTDIGKLRKQGVDRTTEQATKGEIDQVVKSQLEAANNLIKNTNFLNREFEKLRGSVSETGRLFDSIQDTNLQLTRIRYENQGFREFRRGSDFIPVEELQRPFNARIERLTGRQGEAALNVDAILTDLKDAIRQQEDIIQARNQGVQVQNAEQELSRLTGTVDNLREALRLLSDASRRSAGIQERLATLQQDRIERQNVVERFLTSGPEEQTRFNRGIALIPAARQQGLQNLGPLAGDVLNALNALGNQPLQGGQRAADLKAELLAGVKDAAGRPLLPPRQGGEEEGLRKLLEKYLKDQEKAQEGLLKKREQAEENFFQRLLAAQELFLNKQEQAIAASRQSDITVRRAGLETKAEDALKLIRGRDVLEKGGVRTDNLLDTALTNRTNFETFFQTTKDINNLVNVFSKLGGVSEKTNVGRLVRSKGDLDVDILRKQVEGAAGGELNQDAIDNIITKAKAAAESIVSLPDVAGGRARPRQPVIDVVADSINRSVAELRSGRIGPLQTQAKEARDKLQRAELPVATFEKLTPEDQKTFISTLSTSGAELKKAGENFKRAKDEAAPLNQEMEVLAERLRRLKNNAQAIEEESSPRFIGPPIERLPVAKAGGGSIDFSPRGTDRVPALLTPGEFVVNKESTNANLPLLKDINQARGKPLYLQGGGPVDVVDPADFEAYKRRKEKKELDKFIQGSIAEETEGGVTFYRPPETDAERELIRARKQSLVDADVRNKKARESLDQSKEEQRKVLEAAAERDVKSRQVSKQEQQDTITQLRKPSTELEDFQKFKREQEQLRITKETERNQGVRVFEGIPGTSELGQEAQASIDEAKKRRKGLDLQEFGPRVRKAPRKVPGISEKVLAEASRNPGGETALALATSSKNLIAINFATQADNLFERQNLANLQLGDRTQTSYTLQDLSQQALRNQQAFRRIYAIKTAQEREEKRKKITKTATDAANAAIRGAFGLDKPKLGFAVGGEVPGYGSEDSVPAVLTPGEIVMNRSAVSRIGRENLLRANKFANGGEVGNVSAGGGASFDTQGFVNASNILSTSMNEFVNRAGELADAFNKINNLTIQGEFKHTVEVVINGAEAFASMEPAIKDMILNRVQTTISDTFSKNLPELGPIEFNSTEGE